MNISYSTYPWAMVTPGGGERQMFSYVEAIRRVTQSPEFKGLPSKVDLFDMWNPTLFNTDVLHYFACLPVARDFLDYAKKRCGASIVLSPNFWPEPESWEQSGVLGDLKTVLWLSDRIIVNSHIELEALVRLMRIDPSQISVIYNAPDTVFFEPESPDLFRETHCIRSPFILNVANIEPRKNQLAFLKAMKKHPDLKLVVVGGMREKWYRDACVAEAGDQFVHVPALPPNSALLRSALAACEFFAMPSLRETPSIASLEAAAAGTRLLTTDLGSPREYFGDLATYVNPYDIDNMSNAIDQTLNQPRTRALSNHVKARFSWDAEALRLLDLYHDVRVGRTAG